MLTSLLQTYRTSFNPMTNGFVCYLHSLLGVHNKFECTATEVLYIAESNGITYGDSVASLAHRIRGVCVTVDSLAKVNFDMNKLKVFMDLEFELHAKALVPKKGKSTLISKKLCTKLSLMEENTRLTKVNKRLVEIENRLRIKLTQAQRTNVANNKKVNLLRMALNIRPSDSQTLFYKNEVEELHKSLDQQEKHHKVVMKISEKRQRLKLAAMSKEMTKLKEKLHMANLRRIELLEKGIIDIDNAADQYDVSDSSKNSSVWNFRRKHMTPVLNIPSERIPDDAVTSSINPGSGSITTPPHNSADHQNRFHMSDSSSSQNTLINTKNIVSNKQLAHTVSSKNYNPPTAYGEHMKVKLENEEDFKIDPLDDFEYETAIQSGVATMSDSWNYFVQTESRTVNPALKLLESDEIKKEHDIEITNEPDCRILTPDEIKKEQDVEITNDSECHIFTPDKIKKEQDIEITNEPDFNIITPDEIKKEREEIVTLEEADGSQESLDLPDHSVLEWPMTNIPTTATNVPSNVANQARPDVSFTTQNPVHQKLNSMKVIMNNTPATKGRPRRAYSLLNNPHSSGIDPMGPFVHIKPLNSEGSTENASRPVDSDNTIRKSFDSIDSQSSSSKPNNPTPVALYSSEFFQNIIRKKLSGGCTKIRIKTKRKLQEDDSSTIIVKKKTDNLASQFKFTSSKNIVGKQFELKEPGDCSVEVTTPKWGEYPRVKCPKNTQTVTSLSKPTIHDVRSLPDLVRTDHSYCAMVILEMHPC